MKAISSRNESKRLLSIDALRGVAALFVVLYHAIGNQPDAPSNRLWPGLETPVRILLSFGYTGVFLFFVISGFCIHLQWAKRRAAQEDAKIDFISFWRRRLRRLYPPYLIAMLLYLTVYALRGDLHLSRFFAWDVGLHLTMLHNFTPRTTYSINSAFWTLAIEEQLYLGYFLLLFMRIRLGWARTLIICAAARVGWYLMATALHDSVSIPIEEAAAAHWFTWALGALGVEAIFGLISLPRWCRNSWFGLGALFAAAGLTYALPLMSNRIVHDCGWLALDPLWGIGFFIITR